MRTKTIRSLAFIIKLLAAASAATGYFNPEMLPSKYVVPALICVALVSTLKDGLITLCDILDDGKRNGSFDLSKVSALALLGCCVMLSACATTSAFLASPFGQATVQTADQLAKQVLLTTETLGLQQIILQASAKLAELKAQAPDNDLAKESLRIGQIAGYAGVIEAAQTKYVQLTGQRFVLPKNPVPSVTP